MDAGEFYLVLLVSVAGGVVSLFMLKEVLSDFIVSQLIDNLESMVLQIDYEVSPLSNPEWAAIREDSQNFTRFAFDSIRFSVGFSSVFGLCLCIKTFFVRWF